MPRPRGFDDAEIVSAVRLQFAETGFAATSVDDLTRVTGLGKGSLYGAFGGKRQLFELAFADYCSAITDGTSAQLEGSDSTALERLRTYATLIAVNSSAEVNPSGCFLARTVAELASTDQAVADRALATFRTLETAIANCINQAQRHGDIRAGADTRALAGLYISAMRGMESLGKAGMPEAELRLIATAAVEALTNA